jgi:transmembrane sensor
MSERETARTISEAAAEWVARVDRSGEDGDVLAELAAWLSGDERRQGAYFRAQSTWAMLDRARVLAGGRAEEPEGPAETAPRGWLSRRQMLWGGSAAAASLAAIATGVGLWPRPPLRIETALGEIRRVPLKDGSMAAVNTATRLAVTMRPDIRRIALDHGEAWFQVAKDRARPFVVEAGDVRVRAVGTAFSVRRTDDGADVQVTEGVVEVWSVGDEANKRRVAAGARTFVSDASGPSVVAEASVAIDRNLAWRSGQLIFDGDTLGAAAAEFNRYNKVQVRIDDPALASEKFVGRFRTNEPDAFAKAAATILGARAQSDGEQIVLSRK